MIRRHSTCEQLGADLHALVDGHLDGDRAEVVQQHLAQCASCLAAHEQLAALRSTLASAGSPALAPPALSARLAEIAGESSGRPLWMAPRGCGRLVSRRRQRRQRLLGGTVTALVVGVMALGLGLVLAPSLPTVADAAAVASLEYDLSTGAGPVAGAVSAVQATSPGLLAQRDQVSSPRMVPVDWHPVDAAAARALLNHASRPTVGYRGIQRVVLGDGRRFVVAEVEVVQPLGEPLTVTVLGPGGRPLTSGLLSRQGAGSEVVLPTAADSFQQGPGGRIAGRQTTLLEAHRSDGTLLARWWVAEDLGLVLWTETFDVTQAVVRSAGFTTFNDTPTVVAAAGQGGPVSLALVELGDRSSAACAELGQGGGRPGGDGFACPDELAGLPLLELRADSSRHPRVVCALYGEGDARVSVLMRRGQLADEGARFGMAPDRAVLTWQSGTLVYAVTTNAGPAIAQAASDELPHHPPVGDSTWQRVRLGLARLLA